MITKLNLNFLIGIAVAFVLSVLLALPLDNSWGYGIMGVMMTIFFLYVFYLMFKLMSPVKFYQVLNDKAGDDLKKPKYWGYTFVGAMVGVGVIMIVLQLIFWFVYYV